MSAKHAPQGFGRRFEALVFDWDATDGGDVAAQAVGIRAAVEAACAAGIDLAVVSARPVDEIDGQLGARPSGPGELHLLAGGGSEVLRATTEGVEIVSPIAAAHANATAQERAVEDARPGDAGNLDVGLTAKAESVRWYLAHLWRRGITVEQVLIVGDELGPLAGLAGGEEKRQVGAGEPATAVGVGVLSSVRRQEAVAIGGGSAAFQWLLDRQVALRQRGALPIPPSDPGWTLVVDGVDEHHERAHEALLTLGDGRLGTRGSVLAPRRASMPAVFVAGVYRGHGEHSDLQPAPWWNHLSLRLRNMPVRRVLDLHAGLLMQEAAGEFRALQFCSLAQPGLAVLRALASRPALERSATFVLPPGIHAESQDDGAVLRLPVAEGVLESAAVQSITGRGAVGALERIAAYVVTEPDDSSRPARSRVQEAQAAGRERLLIDHRRAWADRWEEADVRIDGDHELQLAVRLALFHLIGCVGDVGEAAVGARALSGRGYRGHVFWDTDVFVLPFLACTHPAAARAILEYRVRRIAASQQAARALGRRGARFAWESAATGEDVTPRAARDRAGRRVEIFTGQREEHIVADVAWAAGWYIDWTGDQAFRSGPGKELIVETARYWASRAERDSDGRAHIRGVIGADEYHELVDDNAYTNVMARWNLRRAFAETTDAQVDHAERAAWPELADALVDGYQAETGLYEQFAGFFDLEPLVISQTAPRRPIAADLLLSPERVARSQVVKQADVLMLHQLIPDEVVPGSLAANLEFYGPRTAHASSLSPGVHAALYARAGMFEDAQRMLALTARIDLDDTAATAGGVHIAAMGSLWQALVLGYGGARLRGDVLELDPKLPGDWKLLDFRLRFRGAKLRVRVSADATEVSTDQPTKISVAGAEPVTVGPSGQRWDR